MIKISPFVFFLVSSLIFFKVSSQPTLSVDGILIEMAQPLWGSTSCLNGEQHLTLVQYDTFFTTVKAKGISLIGFESIVENQIYFKSSIDQINTTHVQITCSCEQDTVFSKIQFSYIIIKDTIVFIEIYSECYLCLDQDSLDGYRKWNFSTTQHTTPYNQYIKISSSMSAFNVSNVEEGGINFNMSTVMKPSSQFLYHTIEAYSWTQVTSICITTIVYDFSLTNVAWAPYQILVQTELQEITWTNQANNIQSPYVCFQNPNSMFYGISAINILFQPQTSQIMIFNLNTPSNLNSAFQGNQNLINIGLSAFYIRQLSCPAGYFFDPISYSCVTTCPAGTGSNSTTNYCQECHQTCASCQGSGINNCLTCNTPILNKFRSVVTSPGSCLCQSGYIEPTDGSVICLSCSQLIPNCAQCTSPAFCSVCASTYVFDPLKNKCGCSNSSLFLTQGVCMSFAGCLTVQSSTNIAAFCSVCDQTKNFELVIQDGSCKCITNFTLDSVLQTCVDLCGDGIVIDSECDDGNTVNGDGCSSVCTIQLGYFCVDKTVKQPSLCMPMWNFTIAYLYASRDIKSNIGTFVFILSPPQPKISQMNLISCLNFTFPSNIISYEYDPVTGQLTVNAEFDESIEGQTQDFSINMVSVQIKTNQIQTNFQVNGLNSWLIRDEYSGIYKYVIYGTVAICFLAWIVAIVVSMLGYRHLAIELIFPIQSIYLVLMQEDSNAPGLRALDFMRFINGYNSLNGFKMKQISSVNDTQYFSLQYLQNLNFFILIDIVLLIVIKVIKNINFKQSKQLNQQKNQLDVIIDEQKRELKKCKTKAQTAHTKQQYAQRIQCQTKVINQLEEKLTPINNATKFLAYRFCTVIILFIIQASIYYLGTNMMYSHQSVNFPALLNNMGCVVCVGLGMFALWIQPCFKDNEITLVIKSKMKYCYMKIYLIWFLVFTGLLIFLQSSNVKGLLLIPIVLLSVGVVFLVWKNPYKREGSTKIRFILPIVQHIVILIPVYLLWVTGFLNTLNPLIYFITTVLIVGCCFIAIVLTIVRAVFEWKYFILSEKKTKFQVLEQNQQDEKEKQTFSKDEQKNSKEYETVLKQNNADRLKDFPNDDINAAQTNKIKQNLSEKQKQKNNDYDSVSSNQDNNEEDLQFIKKRLRTQLKSKRAVKKK